jgi:hypothetical protein
MGNGRKLEAVGREVINGEEERLEEGHASISVRAFAVLVACSACRMMAFLTASESMVGVRSS